ncbi:MAG: trypsin-like peptidase domain-containing protein [Verrucomicrobiae bacterium]|nr:trypsin-like peptidase domain-containing protein [Verrucomicrobiae bacterium]
MATLALAFVIAAAFLPTPARASSSGPALSVALDFRAEVNQAKERVFPAVVFLKCLREDFEGGARRSREVSGSGFLISPKGEILSNWHVVEKALRVRCLLQDGRAFPADIVGSDKATDVALLRLRLPADAGPLPFAVLGDSDALTEGDFVMAMGAPWGLARSVSIGIVSCARRFLPGASEYHCWVQTDAAISPGNSGGPLLNTAGEVIGINTRGAMAGGDLGFAVPSNVAREIAELLRRRGDPGWSWSGLQLQPLRDFDRDMYFDADEGVMVAETAADSPARRAGFLPGDRIVSLNGNPVTARTDEDLPDLRRRLDQLPPDAPARADVIRGQTPLTLSFQPARKGAIEGDVLDCPRWDFTVKAINRFDTPNLHLHQSEGVYVFGVRQPGNAALAGLRPNDILALIDGEPVRTLAEVAELHRRALERIDRQPRAVLGIRRAGLSRQVVLDFSRDYLKE